MSRLGALRWENPPFALSVAPPLKNVEGAIAHRYAPPSFLGLAVRYEDHAVFPIEILDAHPVKLSFVPHARIPHQDDDVPEKLQMVIGWGMVDQLLAGIALDNSATQPGQTADRVLIHVDTELSARDLLNSRMAYVSVSRGRYDAQIYTNNASTLAQELSRDVSHSAIQQDPMAHKIEPQTTHTNEIGQGFGLGL